jgi:hypothetical protein
MAILRRGDRSPAVTEAQKVLNARGAAPQLLTDGVFGPRTEAAVRSFQRLHCLTVDGIIGPATRAALETGTDAGRLLCASRSFVVSLAHAGKYQGQTLGAAPFVGECAAGVQQVFSEAGIQLGRTASWRPGVLVRGGQVAAGTAIASFKNGRYWRHAAILIRETSLGLEVWDQWIGRPWGSRTLRFTDNSNDGSNNGNLFYVITHG